MNKKYSWINLCATIIALISVNFSLATTITVMNTNDAGAGSLRQAVIDATSGDTIDFNLMLIATNNDTIKLASEIAFNKSLVISGIYTSNDTLFISGEGSSRVFNISTTSGTGPVVLDGLTFINGNETNGGAITKGSSAPLTVSNCNFLNNSATSNGGALYKTSSGALTITNSSFLNNVAANGGGAIYMGSNANHLVEYSTFENNVAQASYGGAIYCSVVNIVLSYCTFTGNAADASTGGAVYDWGSAVEMTVTNCTIVGNSASDAGGLDHWGSNVIFTMSSSIVAGNTGAKDIDTWGAGAVSISNGFNIIGDATFGGSLGTDQLNVNISTANLGALQDNGGLTATMMPGGGSVALDLGDSGDMSDAQNGAITDGARDVGSTESFTCPVKYSSFIVLSCGPYTVPSGDETVSGAGWITANDTIMNSCGQDSVMTIHIFNDDVVAPVPDLGTLADITGECEVTPTAPTATDGCAGAITGTSSTSFPITTPGVTVVTWTYDDGGGNTVTQDQNINVTAIDVSVAQVGNLLTSNSTVGTYQWVDCNNGMSAVTGETNQSFTPTTNGSFAVVIIGGSCTDTSACYTIEGIGFSSLSEISFEVYPNPSQGEFVVRTNGHDNARVSIVSVDGKMIVSNQSITSSITKFDLEQIESGIYFVTVQNDNGRSSKRLIIE